MQFVAIKNPFIFNALSSQLDSVYQQSDSQLEESLRERHQNE